MLTDFEVLTNDLTRIAKVLEKRFPVTREIVDPRDGTRRVIYRGCCYALGLTSTTKEPHHE